MKWLFLTILLSFNIGASPNPNCEAIANSAPADVDKLGELIKCLADPGNYIPSWEPSSGRCEQCLLVGEGEWCIDESYLNSLYAKFPNRDPSHDPGVQMESCGTPLEKNTIYCFNGIALSRDVGNLNLMYHLCNGEVLDQGLRLQFGSCQLGQRIKTDTISCYCQYQNGDQSQPLAFHCTGL